MVPYYALLAWFLLTCFVFNQFKGKTRKRLQFFSCVVPAACIASLRDVSVGTDTQQYVDAVMLMKSLGYQAYNRSGLYAGYEYGFRLLMYICTQFGNPSRALIIFSALIIVILPFYVIYRIVENPSIVYVLYYLSTLYYFNLNGMRQSLAVAFLFMSILAVYRKSRFMPFVWFVIAFLFHTTALIFLPLLILSRIRPKISLLFWVPFGSIVILGAGRFLPRLFSIIPKYNGYVSEGGQYLVSGRLMPIIQIVLFIVLLAVFMLNMREKTLILKFPGVQSFEYPALINMAVYACAVAILVGACSLYVNVFYRMMYEMWPIVILILPKFVQSDKDSGPLPLSMIVAYLSIVVFFVAFFFVPTGWFGIDPYMMYEQL
jgi:hypothetical protein